LILAAVLAIKATRMPMAFRVAGWVSGLGQVNPFDLFLKGDYNV
jgi:hypothetical protein